jgi:hypothetical protein
LPVWGFIGEKEGSLEEGDSKVSYYLFTHYIFSITHNGEGQIIEVNWEHDPNSRLDVTDTTKGHDVSFLYSVRWSKSHLTSRDHVEVKAPQHLEIRWFSIFNSIVTVLLLTVTAPPPPAPGALARA